MKTRPWSRITRVGGPNAPATFPPYAEAQARDLLRPYGPRDGQSGAETGESSPPRRPARYRTAAPRSADGQAPSTAPGWDTLVEAAANAYGAPDFVERSLNYSLATAERLRRARGALLIATRRARATHAKREGAAPMPLPRPLRAPAWVAHLARAVPETPTAADDVLSRFADWCAAHPVAGAGALSGLWEDLALEDDRLGRCLPAFLELLPSSVARRPEERLRLGSWLLGAIDPTRYPAYDAPAIAAACALASVSAADPGGDEGAGYAAALAFLDELVAAGAARGLQLGHRLHAAAAIERLGSSRLRRGQVAEARAPHTYGAAPELAALGEELLLESRELEKIAGLLADKGQVIFYGPPGTGKTYVARRLAATLAGAEARFATVQLHPSYAYEDFVEGYRPAVHDGRSSFALVDGPLKRLARMAAGDPSHLYVLVVDELNRGNVAKVFGELYFLLEYRDQAITLQYSGQPFSLPRNLWLIGTMNTADRSIALVDLALRRRFYFVPFFPDQPPVAGLLRRWLMREQPHLLWLADAVDRANALLADRNAAIGPSYFLRSDLDEERIALLWNHAVLPYVAEQLPDAPDASDALAPFHLARLRAHVNVSSQAPQSSRKRRAASPSPLVGEGAGG